MRSGFLKLSVVSMLLLLLTACVRSQTDDAIGWSDASYETIDAITGHYHMETAVWSAPIAFSSEGVVSRDILNQLESYGWAGVVTTHCYDVSGFISILSHSVIPEPASPQQLTQVDLYVPFPEGHKDGASPMGHHSHCSIDIEPYQFHYQVDYHGQIKFVNITDRVMDPSNGTLANVHIHFGGGRIFFEADTSFYDWSTASWQDGHMSVVFKRNE